MGSCQGKQNNTYKPVLNKVDSCRTHTTEHQNDIKYLLSDDLKIITSLKIDMCQLEGKITRVKNFFQKASELLGQFKMEIKIKSFQITKEDQEKLSKLADELKTSQLNISVVQDNKSNILENQGIYQIKDQFENQVQKIEKLAGLLIYHKEKLELNKNYEVNFASSYIKFAEKDSLAEIDYNFNYYKAIFDQTVMLNYSCQSQQEAIIISSILREHLIQKEHIIPQLTDLKVYLTKEIYECMETSNTQLIYNPNYQNVIVIGMNFQNTHISILRSELYQYINNQNKINLIRFPFCQLLDVQPSQKELQEQINKLQAIQFDKMQKKFQLSGQIIKNLPVGEVMFIDKKQKLIQIIKKKINDSLMQYQFTRIMLDCKKDMILDILSKRIYQLPNLFQPSLQNLVKRFPNTQIALVEINQQMIFEIHFQKVITNEQQLQNLIQTEFINKLYIQKIGIDKSVLLQSLGINEKTFEENYQVIFCELWIDDVLQNCILGLQEMTDEIVKIEKEMIQVEVLQCTKQLIFQRLRNHIMRNKIQFQTAQIEFCKNSEIIISANQKELQIVIERIRQFQSVCENQLLELKVNLSQKEIKFVQKNFKSKIAELEQNHELVILFNAQNEPFENLVQANYQIDCENKSLQLVTVNVSRIQCDAAIINFDNCQYKHNKYYSDILDVCGTQYTIFCHNMFDQIQQVFTEGTALSFKLQKKKHVSYIINVNTSYLNENTYEESIIKYLNKTIDSIFQQVNNYQIKSIAIPLFLKNKITQNYSLLMRIYLKRIMQNLFMKSYSIEKVYISQEDYSQINQGQQILNDLVQIRPIQYQWQWHDGKGFVDYEDYINQQIDEAYEQYLQTKQQLKILLHFQESKQPGTHKVNLNKNTIKDLNKKTKQNITINLVNNIKIFSINNQQVSDSLNKYFILQEENNIKKFIIFLKQYQVIFDIKEIIQINLETQYRRLIQFIPYQKNQVISKPSAESLLENKSFIIKKSENFQSKRQENQYQLIIQSFSADLNKLAENTLLDLLNKEILNYSLAIPDLNQNQTSDLKRFLQNKSILFEGEITSNQNVNIKIFQNKQQ